MSRKNKLACIIISILVVLMGATAVYLNTYYHADENVKKLLKSDNIVSVTEQDDAIFFDGPGDKTRALIFYPGAKVEAEAYAPLMHEIAAAGEDCFLVKMPFRLAILDSDAADDIRDAYDYQKWDMAGHSLGGAMAASYVAKDAEDIDRLILLAAYPTEAIDDRVELISIYGSEDGVLNMESYEKYQDNWPKNQEEVVLKGGNHGQFGSYGEQKGDGTATISAEVQRKETVDAIA